MRKKPAVPDFAEFQDVRLNHHTWQFGPDLRVVTSPGSPVDRALQFVFPLFRTDSVEADSPLPVPLEATPDPATGGWILCAFRQPLYRLQKEAHLVPAVESLVAHLFSRMQKSPLVLHTGMVEWQGQGVLIPGDRGSGKSTLSLWLSRTGARYYGDDLILFDPVGNEIRAFPKAVTLKAGSFRCFEEVPTYEDPIRGPVRYFLPSTAGLHRLPLANLKLMVFPEYTWQGGTPRRLQPGWTALGLVQQLLGGLEWNDQGLALVSRLASIPAYVLPYRELPEAEDFIRSQLGREVCHASLG